MVEHFSLNGSSVFHSDHDAGQQALKYAGRCEVIGGADFF